MNKLSWCDKYRLALNESLSVKEIMLLRDCGQPKALKIRSAAISYCIENHIDFDSRGTPIEAIFEVTNLNLDYYYNKMLLENKCLNLGGLNVNTL